MDKNYENKMNNKNFNIFYATFGQDHKHTIDGFVYDKDIVVSIKAINRACAFEIMCQNFGYKWASIYKERPDTTFFPRGVVEFN